MRQVLSLFANDSVITEGSEIVAVNYDEHDISIDDEQLDIYLCKDFYKVTVRYEYFNTDAEKKIRLGFPIKYASTADKNEIWLYTKAQIQLYINYFYAIRGYVFKNQKLRDYFDGMSFDVLNEPCRYTPDENFTEQKFNDVEKANIAFLRKLKNKLYE